MSELFILSTILFLIIIFSFAVATAANSRNRSFFGWLLIAFLISPILAAILLFILPKAKGAIEEECEIDTKNCPRCAESVKINALVCRYCSHEFSDRDAISNNIEKSYKDIEYTLNSRNEVKINFNGNDKLWKNESEFKKWVDDGAAR